MAKRYISLYACAEEHIAGFKDKHPEIKTGKVFFALFVVNRFSRSWRYAAPDSPSRKAA